MRCKFGAVSENLYTETSAESQMVEWDCLDRKHHLGYPLVTAMRFALCFRQSIG